MGRKRFHGLKKIKIRQSWNKYNLYNISRATRLSDMGTFFQQKWKHKSASRAYHGETVREQHWNRMFRSSIPSVVPMRDDYLSSYDGSEQAEGRGSGKEVATGQVRKPVPRTPYMTMVYAPLERRLDTAIFRALFASSTRQARQFVVHGDVKVNGKKMIYPGYQLNPGDMFQVEPERVLFATGAPKSTLDRRAARRSRAQVTAEEVKDEDAPAEPESSAADLIPANSENEPQDAKEAAKQKKKDFKGLYEQAEAILKQSKTTMSAKRKQALRAFQRTLRRSISRPDTFSTDDLDSQLQEITSHMSLADPPPPPPTPRSSDESLPVMSSQSLNEQVSSLTQPQLRVLRSALIEARENPIDHTKAYATPWRPRDYMSAFAFIPRYLEVHHRICSAVYVRHPVARPILSEIPTPFNMETYSMAHAWYLKRR